MDQEAVVDQILDVVFPGHLDRMGALACAAGSDEGDHRNLMQDILDTLLACLACLRALGLGPARTFRLLAKRPERAGFFDLVGRFPV